MSAQSHPPLVRRSVLPDEPLVVSEIATVEPEQRGNCGPEAGVASDIAHPILLLLKYAEYLLLSTWSRYLQASNPHTLPDHDVPYLDMP